MEIGSGIIDVFGFANTGLTGDLRTSVGVGIKAQSRLSESISAFLQAKAWYEEDWQAEILAGARIRW